MLELVNRMNECWDRKYVLRWRQCGTITLPVPESDTFVYTTSSDT